MTFDDTVFSVDSDTGEVTHMLVGTCQLVEKGGLAAVLLSSKSEGQFGAFGQRCLMGLVVIDAFFT